MNFALDMYARSLVGMSRAEIGERMRKTERLQGFTIVTDAKWLDWADWDKATIISQDGKRIRLVALQAKVRSQGAFTRLIQRIFAQGLVPVLVEPNADLMNWCHRHNFRSKRIGKGAFKHEIWYPRRDGY